MMKLLDALEISDRVECDFIVVTLRGALDIASAGGVREFFANDVFESDREAIIDLTHLSFMDSTGLGALVSLQKRMPHRVRLVVTSGPIDRLLRITALINVFAVYGNIDDARAGVGRIRTLHDHGTI